MPQPRRLTPEHVISVVSRKTNRKMEITKHCNLLYYKDFDTASNFSPKIFRFTKKLISPIFGPLIAMKSHTSQSPAHLFNTQNPKCRSHNKNCRTKDPAATRFLHVNSLRARLYRKIPAAVAPPTW